MGLACLSGNAAWTSEPEAVRAEEPSFEERAGGGCMGFEPLVESDEILAGHWLGVKVVRI